MKKLTGALLEGSLEATHAHRGPLTTSVEPLACWQFKNQCTKLINTWVLSRPHLIFSRLNGL